MEPVRGGKLADVPDNVKNMFKNAQKDKSIASWAIGFAASLDNVITVLSGMNSSEQLEDNLSTLTNFKPFDEKQLQLYSNAAAMLNNSNIIPCTGCDYCADCPKKVKISSIFALYNKVQYNELTAEEGRKLYSQLDFVASDYIACSKCTNHCPQGIKILELLAAEITDMFG